MPITVPNQGEATKQPLIAAIINATTEAQATANAALVYATILNGSFETDSDANGIPDNWERTLQTAGAFVLDTTSAHGAYAAKFTSIGGGGNGGGYLQSADFFEVSPVRFLSVSWLLKSSVAGVKNIVAVRWYSAASEGSYISTTTLWSEDTNNPTSFTEFTMGTKPPSTARFAKLVLTGCDSSDATAGSTWFDGVRCGELSVKKYVEFTTAGTHSFIATTTSCWVELIAGGGGGAGGGDVGGTGGSGGTSGQYAYKFITGLTVGQSYSVVVGSGGAGDTGAGNGATGGDSTFNSTTCIAKGGPGGNFNGTASSLAAAGTGDEYTQGVASLACTGGNGSDGGDSVRGRAGGTLGTNPNGNGTNGVGEGAGGGGGGYLNGNGGNGAAGFASVSTL